MAENNTFNFLSSDNGVRVIECSSASQGSSAEHVLQNTRKSLWLSEHGLPQHITFDLSGMVKKPKHFKCFGLDCWHDYQSNPKKIELLVSPNDKNYINWGTIQLEMVSPRLIQIAGCQFFEIDPLPTCYSFFKVVVHESFGDPRVYVNQMFLLADKPKSVSEQIPEPVQLPRRSSVMSGEDGSSQVGELRAEVDELRRIVALLQTKIEVLEETVDQKESRVRHLTELVNTMALDFKELVQQECAQMRKTILREVWSELGMQQRSPESRPDSRAGEQRDFTLAENHLTATNGKNSDSSLRMQQRALVDLVKQFKATLHLRVAPCLTNRIRKWSSSIIYKR